MAKTKTDPLLAGYYFSYDKDKTPYDFLTDEKTGLRPTQHSKPNGYTVSNLTAGTNNVTMPPLAIWKDGDWLPDVEHRFDKTSVLYPNAGDVFDTWVVSGSGTPGNYAYRMFLLPEQIARTNLNGDMIPKHPAMWSKALKAGVKKAVTATHKSTNYQYGTGWSTSAKKEPALPFGIRIRCTKCGHWFKADDLATHVQCCPQVNQFSDWAVACECCASMDGTATVKPGFPREMTGTKPPVDEAEGVSDNGGSAETPERPPGDPVDTEGSGAAD